MSSASSDSSSAPASPPSTAPSTPFQAESAAYFIVTHEPSAAFLKSLPARRGSDDRILLFLGTGPANALLEQAVELLEDCSLREKDKWELMKTNDGGKEISYYRTKTQVSTIACTPSIDINALNIQTTSCSYSSALNIFADASLRVVVSLPSPSTASPLSLHVLERPPLSFPRLSLTSASVLNTSAHPYGTPSLSEFQDGWRAWDLITLGMIPPSLLHSKPIDLRHKPLFYLGHLPTFLNLLMTAYLREPPVAPARFTKIFERGIDPHVDDPEHCHSHSEVPERDEDWPALGEVLAYRDRVRARLAKLYDELEAGTRTLTRRLARTLMMILEHDGFHIETLLYILIQRAGTGMLPPPGFASPPWAQLAAQWDNIPAPSTPHATLGPCTLTMGHDDPEPADLIEGFEADVQGHEFGWDNESPKHAVEIGRFKIDWRPVTNGEFLAYWRGAGKDRVAIPPSWVEEDGEVRVRTLYGPIAMEIAHNWPVLTSYDDLATYAASKGGRIPTEPELRLFLDTYQVGYEEGANMGFRNWHPMPATAGCEKDGLRGSNGGVWEWSSTLFDTHEGFEGTTIFPGYSSDFFDTKHQVVLGASYATIPRLGDRRTVRNFYQHNYPYPWVGARVAYDF
ncbi:uncharacterized protein FIBRA_01016 [Fibroporia radiculosa]|uniref:Sulfatase-modifying factor enzyme domain-containing protein n=1 Tax=Fibroporia radiculosa TaxID=599839 RepID=J4G0R2_9APHY|nr:uncharacterized protein FIBRA_01016 [Fibroporia radiculosa]CCL99008.1 predicted protein [Fibroporia radiculosa]